MGWTQRQEKAITESGKSLLISAAAGSGKTSVLVERVTQLLRNGSDLSRMLIVTFTNAAAAEMKERIAKSLGSNAVRHSHISTFHSFALDVIRKYYYVIGINPGLSVCDEYRQTIMKNKAMDKMFEEYFEADDPDFIDFLNCYASAKSNYTAQQMIFQTHRFLESLPDPEGFLKATDDMSFFDIEAYLAFAAKEGEASLRRSIGYISAARDLAINPNRDGAGSMPKLAEKLGTDIESLKAILSKFENNKSDEAYKMLDVFSFTRLNRSNDEKASFIFIEDEFSILQDAWKKEISGIRKSFAGLSKESFEAEKKAIAKPLRELVKLTRRFDELYRINKLKDSLMDFSDIEHFALAILKNKDVADELKESFDYIFVDEYQDSNSVQDELISKIAKENNLFFVGDVKQSIYKFRHAEPELFIKKYDAFKSGCNELAKVIDLNANFRSKSSVIDFVNKVFSVLMTRDSAGIEYDEDAALIEGAPYLGKNIYESKFYLVNTSTDDERVDEEIEDLKDAQLEALEIVNIIKEYHGKLVYDAKKKIDRPLEYSDMVILMRSVKGRGEYIYNALSNADIPVFLQREGGYFDTPEIQVTLNLLKIIDNFRQDLALISVLSFPSFGFTPEELAKLRIYSNSLKQRNIGFSDAYKLYAMQGPDESLKTKLNSFLIRLNYWRKKSENLSLPDFFWELIAESGISEYALALPTGMQRIANLRALADKAQEYEEENAGGLFGFISYIEIISEKAKGVETGQVSVLGEGANAVRIMTIHKSKGLEFPFVLLAGTGSKLPNSKDKLPLYTHQNFGVSMKLVEPKKGLVAMPVSAELISLKKKKEDLAETIRILYVALTRAKDIFVASAAVKNGDKLLHKDWSVIKGNPSAATYYMDMLLPFYKGSNIEFITRDQLSINEKDAGTSRNSVLDYLDSGFALDEQSLPLSRAEIKERLEFDFSPKDSDLMKTKYSVSELAELSRAEHGIKHYQSNHRKPQFIEEISLNAAAKGTAYHNIMEHIPFTPDGKSEEEIIEFIEDLKRKRIITEQEAGVVEPARIKAFFESDIGQRAMASDQLYKEAPFVLKTEFKGRTVYVQGTIDCYFKEDDKYVLLDYKSNYIDIKKTDSEKERLKENYIPQLKLYKEALEQITGTAVKESVLYLFGINDTIKIC